MKSRSRVLLSRFLAACAGLLALLLLLVGTERPAQAYIDPGTGMMIWQTVVAAVLGVAFYFRKILSWFRPQKRKNKSTEGELSQSDQQGPAA